MAGEVDLFVYGTLMNENVLYSLTGRYFPRYEAELSGFERFTPHNGYPYIVPNPRARVQGILLAGIDPTALAALDRYEEEGRLYPPLPGRGDRWRSLHALRDLCRRRRSSRNILL